MVVDSFKMRKQEVLAKLDKSSKQSWDKPILELCEKINDLENYYTTSSCSGRVLVMVDQEKKGPGLFEYVSHDLINLKKLKDNLNKVTKSSLIKFKQEPCILHVACKDLNLAQELLDKASRAGWKRSGIISSGKRFIVEMNGTDKLEFPIMKDGKILVDDEFLGLVVEKSNKNMKRSWEMIGKLKNAI
jgi:tRNA wybutosine-synthesizing protein 3